MGDSGGTPLEGTPGGGTSSGGASSRVLPNMENFFGALASLMEQQRAQPVGGYGSTKALKGVVDKIGRFDGKNVTNFLKVYLCEMEVHLIPEDRMIQAFGLAVIPEIRDRVREIMQDEAVNTWAAFEERLRDEYFDEDSERMTKRSFLDWVEQQPGKTLNPTELLKDFEKKYNQLPMADRHILDARKAELFLQAADDSLEDRLLLLLGDRATECGFTSDWRRIEETVILIAKQQRVKGRSLALKMTHSHVPVVKTPKVISTPSASPSTSKSAKLVDEGTLEELIKGFKELKVEMSELRKTQASSSLKPSDSGRRFEKRCVMCDKVIKEGETHRLRDCDDLDDAIGKGLVYFKDSKLHDAATDLPLSTNYGKGGMKKLLEEKLGNANTMHAEDATTYNVEVECCPIDAPKTVKVEMMKRGAHAIRKATGWEDPVDASSILAFLGEPRSNDEQFEASVEEKRGRSNEGDEVEGPAQKKRPQGAKEVAEEERPSVNTRSKPLKAKIVHPEFSPLPDKVWGESSGTKKGKEKEDSTKAKTKGPAYKLQSDIETSIDLKGVLEERILDAKIEFTLREALGIAKKDFHELIIDIIKRKRQMTAETVMTHALDTHMTKEEEMEIGEVFALMVEPVVKTQEATFDEKDEDVLGITDDEEYEILQMFAKDISNDVGGSIVKIQSLATCDDVVVKKLEGVNHMDSMATNKGGCEIEVNTFDCAICSVNKECSEKPDYVQSFWARATTETRVKLGGCDDTFLALVDHGSEINIMSRNVYEKGKWPIDTQHGWVMRAANSGRTQLYGACPAVSAKIGDVEVEQNFFVSNHGAYPVILGQPYITASRMETKVLDDGSHYARIRSLDGKKTVQFLTVKSENERHRLQLRDEPVSYDFVDF